MNVRLTEEAIRMLALMRSTPLMCSAGGIPYNKEHLDAKDAEIERLRGLFIRLREEGHDKQCCKDLDDLVVDAIGP